MNSLSRLLLCAVIACAALRAQGPWFVDGQQGVDAPGRGTSAAQPWKTIGYALAQAQTTGSANTDTVFVTGGQVYAAATNGEVLPLALRPGLAVRGLPAGSVPPPVLLGAAGDTIAALDPNHTHARGTVALLRDLVFEGGSRGLVLGSALSNRHSPWVEACTFTGQTVSSVQLVSRSNQLDDPLFRDCRFESSVLGIEAMADATLAMCAPQVQACSFRGITGTAIDLREGNHDPMVGQLVVAAVDGSTFDQCGNGLRVRGPLGVPVPATVFVRTSRFADIAGPAVSLEQGAVFGVAWTSVAVEQCSLLRCGTGALLLLGSKEKGGLTVRGSTAADCTSGIRVATSGTGYNARVRVELHDNAVLRCTTGIAMVPGEDAVTTLALRQARVLECGTGLHCELFGSAVVESVIVARCQLGLRASVNGAEFQHLTVADNQVGFRVQNVSALPGTVGFESSAVRNSAFGGNAIDVEPQVLDPGMGLPLVQTLSFFHRCCLQATATSNQGNLGLTDPQLVRPYYKLAAASPCIDAAVPGPVAALADYEGGARAVAGVPSGVPVADLGADEFVPAGSAHVYGTGGVGAWLTVPHMAARGIPSLGATFMVDLSEARSGFTGAHAWFGLLGVGWRDDPGALPLDLAPYGLRNSLLWNEFATTGPYTPVSTAGAASMPVGIPNSVLLVGLTCTFQWHCQMPWAEVVSTEALRVTIGQ